MPLLLGGCGEKKKNSYYEGVLGDLSYYGTTTGDAICIGDCEPSATGDLVIPETIDGKPVIHIAENAFSRCTNLTSITIPDSVTSIGRKAFSYCTNLTSITIPDNVTSIGSAAFWGCASLTSITIPDSVTSIGSSNFYGCTSLTSITIPDSVTSIGSQAFFGCIGATSIAQLEANWAAACLRLPDAVLRKIDEIHVRMRNPNLHD